MYREQQVSILQVTKAGLITAGVARIAFLSRLVYVAGSLYGGNGTTVPAYIGSQTQNAGRMLTRIDQVTQFQRELYLAISQSLALPCLNSV